MKRQLLIGALFLVSLGASAQYVWLSQSTGLIPTSSGVRYVSAVTRHCMDLLYDGSGGAANRTDFPEQLMEIPGLRVTFHFQRIMTGR